MDDFASSTPRLRVSGLHKAFAAPVLRGIDMEVREGEIHALIGANGAGKSTLSKIIAGLLRPDSGTLALEGRPYAPANRRKASEAGVQIVHQELNLIPTLSVGENLYLGDLPTYRGLINRRAIREGARRSLAMLGLEGLDPDTPLSAVGIGHQQLIEIAAALARDCRLLLLDEPTAALTDPQVERLFGQLKRRRAEGAGLVYVSHRLEELRQIADRVSVLRDGKLVATVPAESLSVPEAVRLMVGREVIMRPPHREIERGPMALRVAELSCGEVLKKVSLDVHQGEILGIAGLVGAGRTELLRAIVAADRPDSGTITVGDDPAVPLRATRPSQAARQGVGMVPEDRKRSGLLLPLSVRVNGSLGRLPALGRGALRLVDRRAERAEVESAATRTQLRCGSLEQPIAELSGGNQQKVLLGRWMLRKPRVLLLDEPTRGVDLEAREAIHRLLVELADSGTAIVLVSSEFEELLALCDRIGVLSSGRMVRTVERGEADWTTETLLQAAFQEHLTTRGDRSDG